MAMATRPTPRQLRLGFARFRESRDWSRISPDLGLRPASWLASSVATGLVLGGIVAVSPTLAFAAMSGLLLVVLAIGPFRWLAIATVATILFVPKVNVLGVSGSNAGIRPDDLVVAVAVIRAASAIAVTPTARRFGRAAALYLLLAFVAVLAGLAQGTIDAPLNGLLFWLRKVEYLAMALVGLRWFRTDLRALSSLNNLLLAAVPFWLLCAMLQARGVLGNFDSGTYQPHTGDRAMAFFGGPYEYAAMLLIVAGWIFGRMWFAARLRGSWAAALIVPSLMLTQSRISLVALVVMAALLGIAWRSREAPAVSGVAKSGAMALGALAIASVNWSISSWGERFATLDVGNMWTSLQVAFVNRNYEWYVHFGQHEAGGMTLATDPSFGLRMQKWMHYIDGFEQYPLLGLGPGATAEAVDGNYVRLVAESGLLGTLAWTLMVAVVLYSAWRRRQTDPLAPVVLFVIGSMLLGAVFIDVFEASRPALITWLIVGAFCAEKAARTFSSRLAADAAHAA